MKYRGFRTTFVLLVAVLLLLPGITQAQSQRQRVPDFTLMSNRGRRSPYLTTLGRLFC